MPYLSDFKPGDRVKVLSIKNVERHFRHQLATLGIQQNKIMRIRQIAPLGDPICIEIEGSLLALRRTECKEILVEPV